MVADKEAVRRKHINTEARGVATRAAEAARDMKSEWIERCDDWKWMNGICDLHYLCIFVAEIKITRFKSNNILTFELNYIKVLLWSDEIT